MPVAEIFLSSLVSSVSRILTSPEFWNFVRREGIDKVLLKWRRMWEQIEAVLADAEEKQMRLDHGGIRLWLEDLEDLAYDLDDVLDEFNTEALRRQVMADPEVSTSKVRAIIATSSTSFSPRSLWSNYKIRSKVDEITNRLQDLFDRRAGLGLQSVAGAGPSARAPQRPTTTSLIPEPRLYGRDDDKKAVIELLLGDQSSNTELGVVPIVGMGGVGKTTLAQMVYNDKTVEEHFDKRAWVHVSDEFDIMKVTKAILESVTSQPCKFRDLDPVQTHLKQALAGKKFLIVLDDVWSKKHNDWSSLKSPFNHGAPGSKVMVTTRDAEVALMVRTVKHYSLEKLSTEDCWSVFAQLAFENTTIDANSNLVSIGRKITEKCGGLPLAARTLGGLLRDKLRDDEWKDVLDSKIWELPHEKSDILPALRLSYHHLPSHLKKCFVYCSTVPKGWGFYEEDIVFEWMANGYIQQPTGGKQMEDLGSEYFRELVSRSLFQPSTSGEMSLFDMHDLVNDMAQFFARTTCFRLEDKLRDKEWQKDTHKARHSSFLRSRCDGITKFEAFRHAKNLRTFLSYGTGTASYLTSDVPLDLLPKLKRLRLIYLRRYQIEELPSSIGELRHLRFLDFSRSLITRLPDSLSTLYNLQTLCLRYCKQLSRLPTNMRNLINLRHLDVTGADSLQEMPPKIGKLTSLQTLSNFIVSKGDGSTIRELGSLLHLRGALHISKLENVVDALDARGANLNEKQGLETLLLRWSSNSSDSQSGSVESEVLVMLEPHKELKHLTIDGYHGLKFPAWVGNHLFYNMISLELRNCEKCTSLPPLGQLPSLAKLYIQGMKAVVNVGVEFYGLGCSNPFSSLEILTFEDMPEWKDWSPFGINEETQGFCCLSQLSIRRCPKLLHGLPRNLPQLRNLDIEDCPQLVLEWVSSPTDLNEVRNALEFNSLVTLSLEDVTIQDDSCSSEVCDGAVPENARYSHWSSLTSLKIQKIQKIKCLPNWFVQGLTGLQELTICDCKDLTTLWQTDARMQHRLPALRRLVIQSCPQLIALFEEEEEKVEGKHEGGLPDIMMLEYLKIEDCEKLEKMPRGLHTLQSLQELVIDQCPCLVSFPKTGLPSTLKTMRIENCKALQSLTPLGCSNLKQLWIVGCEKLESLLAEEGMRINCPSLESIVIGNCGRLESLPEVMQTNDLRNLRKLEISECDNLESLPEGWLAAANLRELTIWDCEKLEGVLPQNASNENNNNRLASLQRLRLLKGHAAATSIVSYILKGVGSSSSSSFSNLTELCLWNVDVGGKRPSEWVLHRFSSLGRLSIGGYGWESFPPEEDGMMSLPTSLIELQIMGFPKLEKLTFKEIRNLASLDLIDIRHCPALTSISEVGLLPSLSSLWIEDCPKLASFLPKKAGLPPSLLELWIWKCPILAKRCEKGKGKYWRFISHIPDVKIEDRSVYDLCDQVYCRKE